jgi:hypothetical protein
VPSGVFESSQETRWASKAMAMKDFTAKGIFMETRLGINFKKERRFSNSLDIIDHNN